MPSLIVAQLTSSRWRRSEPRFLRAKPGNNSCSEQLRQKRQWGRGPRPVLGPEWDLPSGFTRTQMGNCGGGRLQLSQPPPSGPSGVSLQTTGSGRPKELA